MSLRQLAGPFDLLPADGAGIPAAMSNIVWLKNVGLFANMTSLTTGSHIIMMTMDGVYQQLANQIKLDGLWLESNRIVTLDNSIPTAAVEYEYETKAFLYRTVDNQDPVLGINFDRSYVRVANRRIYADAFRLRVMNGTSNGDLEFELPINADKALWAGRTDFELFFADGGKCGFYDATAKQLSSNLMYFGVSCRSAAYVPEFDVIITLHGNGTTENFNIRIWSTEVKPFSLSDPVLIAGLHTAGNIATYRVRALGDAGEPCVGELIDWTLTGIGNLLKIQSKTDVDGYATIRVQYKLNEIGSTVVGASLTC